MEERIRARAAAARGRAGLLALVLALGGAACGGPAPREAGPNLLLLTVDTLRADHLGAWGHALPTSPRIDAFAAQGMRFEEASVQWTKTWPSMASMLTGRYPTQTGIRYAPRRPLPERNVTLAELLRDAGYRTAGVVSNANLSRELAFDQGFHHYVESWMEEYRRTHGDRPFRNRAGLVKRFTDAKDVVDEGLAWLEEHRTRDEDAPFFLWLHFMEPHGPYEPPPGYGESFEGHYPPRRVPLARIPPYQRQRDARGRPVRDLAFYQTRYDQEIRYLDDQLGRLLDALERRGLRRSTLVAFTADHGESLTEHGYYLEHGQLPFEPGAHVPLVLAQEGAIPAGRTVAEPVGLVDLLPTLLELLEVPAPEGLVGRSLVPLLRGEGEARPLVFVEAGTREPSQRAVRRGPWKLVHFRSETDREQFRVPEYALFHLQRDPSETRNLVRRHPEVAEELRRALAAYERTATAGAEEEGTVELDELDPATREMLRSLGYAE